MENWLWPGPMLDETGLEGIFVFNVTTVAEAEGTKPERPSSKSRAFRNGIPSLVCNSRIDGSFWYL
jgi:hypothetical protein